MASEVSLESRDTLEQTSDAICLWCCFFHLRQVEEGSLAFTELSCRSFDCLSVRAKTEKPRIVWWREKGNLYPHPRADSRNTLSHWHLSRSVSSVALGHQCKCIFSVLKTFWSYLVWWSFVCSKLVLFFASFSAKCSRYFGSVNINSLISSSSWQSVTEIASSDVNLR